MAKTSVSKSSSSALDSVGTGPKLVGLGALLFVITRIVIWLPLGFLGSWINGVLWPVLILCIIGGVGLMALKSKRF